MLTQLLNCGGCVGSTSEKANLRKSYPYSYILFLLRYALGQGSPVPLMLLYRKTVPVGRVKNLYPPVEPNE